MEVEEIDTAEIWEPLNGTVDIVERGKAFRLVSYQGKFLLFDEGEIEKAKN